jgi:hypothetical protein
MSAAAKVLDRLHNVKQLRPDNWAGGCPLCQSRRGRPISVRAVDDRVLVYPFCGCSTEAVLNALGLQIGDLYNQPLGQAIKPSNSRISGRDVLECISFEADVIVIILAEVLDAKAVSELGWQRLAQAAARIGRARDHVNGK